MPRILVAEDDSSVRGMLHVMLERDGFDVVAVSNVRDALHSIATEDFDALLSDLHMPDAGDGFTVVSAMRHTHPKAVTLVLSGYPALKEAMDAILLEADEVLVKPVGLAEISELIQKKLSNPSARMAMNKERVAAILERDADATIQNWMFRVENNEELMAIPLSSQERT